MEASIRDGNDGVRRKVITCKPDPPLPSIPPHLRRNRMQAKGLLDTSIQISEFLVLADGAALNDGIGWG